MTVAERSNQLNGRSRPLNNQRVYIIINFITIAEKITALIISNIIIIWNYYSYISNSVTINSI